MIPPQVSRFATLAARSAPIQRHFFQFGIVKNNRTIEYYVNQGRLADARQVFDKMPKRDGFSWNCMIKGYCQNGRLSEANYLFNSCIEKDVRTWTILLTGYAKNGKMNEARVIFESMPEPNVVSWNALVSGYVQNGDLAEAREVFDRMPERNVSSWNSMITGYCRCGMMREARDLFDMVNEWGNSVTWMVMVSGYVEINKYREAWGLFLMMLRSGMRPDKTFLAGFSAIVGLNNLDLLESLRTAAMKMGFEEDVVVGTQILNAYTRIGTVDVAFKFFELMPKRNEYSYTTMISAFSRCGRSDDAIALYERDSQQCVPAKKTMITVYAQKGRIYDARKIFDEIVDPDVVSWNAMLAGYAQNGMTEEAKDFLLKMPVRNAASWSAMISGLVQHGNCQEGLEWFYNLHRVSMLPSHSGFTSALLACASRRDIEMGKQIHSLSIKTGAHLNLYVGNGLINMYAKCNNVENFSQVLSTMKVRDTVSWNSVISGFSENSKLDDAINVFKRMPDRDVASWTAIISAFVQAGQEENALKIFLEMLAAGIKPKDLTITSLLSACGAMGVIKLGQQFHALLLKYGFHSSLCVSNSLISMYLKCGILDGLLIFEEMSEKDLVTWNTVLTGCAQSGLVNEALKFFDLMIAIGIIPDEISFLGVLLACSHAGLVDEGWAYFNSMSRDYGIIRSVSHYTCMVTLLGKSGWLNEAEALIESMPVKPDILIWEALLHACWIHRNLDLGQRVVENFLQMRTQKYGTDVLFSEKYAAKEMRDKVGEIREGVKDSELGVNWIPVKDKLKSKIFVWQ